MKKILVIVIGAGVLIGAVAFVLLNRQNNSQVTVTNFNECLSAGYPVGESFPRQCWTPDGRHFVEDIERPLLPEETSVTKTGNITCLKKIGTGPQTMECAIGFKADDGSYYALKNLFEIAGYEMSRTDIRVEVTGTLGQEDLTGPDGNRYDIVGVINLTSITEL